jgi:membrane protease YdiL (CAAX protease family)
MVEPNYEAEHDFFATHPPLRLLALGVSLIVVYQIVLGFASRSESLDPRLAIILASLSVEVLLPVQWIRSSRAALRQALRLHALPPQQALWTLLLAMSLLLPVEFLGTLNARWIPVAAWFESAMQILRPTDTSQWILAIGAIVLAAPLGEEIVFRGLMQQAARQGIGGRNAPLAIGVLFALIHFAPWYLLPLSMLGIVLGLSFERTGTLWTPILLHAAYNGTSLGVLGFGELQDVPIPMPMLGILATLSAGMAYVSYGRLRVVARWESEISDATARWDDRG